MYQLSYGRPMYQSCQCYDCRRIAPGPGLGRHTTSCDEAYGAYAAVGEDRRCICPRVLCNLCDVAGCTSDGRPCLAACDRNVPPPQGADMTEPCGIYGDSTYGHRTTRVACAAVLATYADRLFIERGIAVPASDDGTAVTDVVAALRGSMTDDANEEYLACWWLNEYAGRPEATWGWNDGDFGLWSDDQVWSVLGGGNENGE